MKAVVSNNKTSKGVRYRKIVIPKVFHMCNELSAKKGKAKRKILEKHKKRKFVKSILIIFFRLFIS